VLTRVLQRCLECGEGGASEGANDGAYALFVQSRILGDRA